MQASPGLFFGFIIIATAHERKPKNKKKNNKKKKTGGLGTGLYVDMQHVA